MDAVPLIVGHVLGMQRVAADAGRADEHVEPVEPVDGGIQLGRSRARRRRSRGRRRAPRRRRPAAARRRRADPARAARDQRHAPFEVVVVAHRAFLYGFLRGLRSAAGLPARAERPDLVPDAGRHRARRPELHGDGVEATRAAGDAGDASAPGRGRRARPAGRSSQTNLVRAAELAPLPDDDDPRDLHRTAPPPLVGGGARGVGRAARRARGAP